MANESDGKTTRRNSKGGRKRNSEKNPGLDPKNHPQARWEYLDFDYINQLNDEEKAKLSKFIDEYYGASLAPAAEPKQWKKDFHKSKAMRKDCRDRNNARNRDLYSRSRIRGWIAPIYEKLDVIEANQTSNPSNHEDAVIEILDMKKTVEKAGLKNRKERSENGSDNES